MLLKEASHIYLRGDGRLHLRKPRIYWGEPGNPSSAPVIYIRRTKPEHHLYIRNARVKPSEHRPGHLYIRKPRIYWGEPGNPSSAPVIYARSKHQISGAINNKAA